MNDLRYQLDLLKAMNQKLADKERMYHLICDTADSAFLYDSMDKNELATLGRWQDFFDFTIEERRDMARLFDVVDEPYIMLLRDAIFLEKSGRESTCVECMKRDKKGWLRFQVRVAYQDSGAPADKIIVIDDISKMMSQREELTYMAYYDGLTGLYNRNYFVSRLGDYVRRAEENGSVVSVLIIDIDDFRKVNDSLGIIVGDELVQMFGSFLKDFSDENVMVAHLNSDVYCMAIYEPGGKRSVEHIHKIIQRRTRDPFVLSGGQSLKITVSMGVAEYPEASGSALELLNCAELVMFKGKSLGKNTIQYFDTPILKEFLRSVEIENQLKEAIVHEKFELYYQPQYYAGNKRLRGMEALIRWRDQDGKMVSPSVFIPIAEKTGSIIPIGKWVVEESIRQYAQWRTQYGLHFVMSINISALQYSKENFIDNLLRVMKKYQVVPSEIELEITESVLIDDFRAVSEKMKLLRDYGIRIALDDFGTGYSSLSYLKGLPIDTLKIDKAFTDTVLTDSVTRIITESIINMVTALGVESVAEGVEDEQQYEYLHAVGCNVIQGYLFGKPQPAKQIEEMLQKMH